MSQPTKPLPPPEGNSTTMSLDALRAFYAPAPSEKWARRAFHGSIVYGNWLFIDGGEAAIGQEPLRASSTVLPYSLLPVNCSLSIPLNESWTPNTLRFNAIPKPSMTRYNFQSLFYDAKRQRIDAHGGELSYLTSDEPDLAIWSFHPDNNSGLGTWEKNNTVNDPPFTKGITRNLGAATTSHDGQFYSLGGYTSPHTSPQTVNTQGFIPTPGIVAYNSTTSTWTNSTDLNGPSPLGTMEWAGLEAVPLGPNGLIAVIGGDTSAMDTYVPGQNRRSMTSISLYDSVSKRWYQQETTGTPPSQRSRFCTVGVRDRTKVQGKGGTGVGTYEIFMYGGWGGILGASAKQYDEVWILTLPSFHWFLASSQHNAPRIGHTCHTVGNRQLLSIGGQDVSMMDPWGTPDTTNTQGIGIFDMSALNWTKGYDATAKPYRRPDFIEKFYKDSADGMPAKWTDPALKALVLHNTTVPLPGSSPNSTNPSTSHLPKPTQNKTALIAGLTSSLVILLLAIIIAALILFFKHRQRRIAHADAKAMEARVQEYKRSRYIQQELAGDSPPAQELPVGNGYNGYIKSYPNFQGWNGGWTTGGRAELGGDIGAMEKDAAVAVAVRNNSSISSNTSSGSGQLSSPTTTTTRASTSTSTKAYVGSPIRSPGKTSPLSKRTFSSGTTQHPPAIRSHVVASTSPSTTTSPASPIKSPLPNKSGARSSRSEVVSLQSPAAAAATTPPPLLPAAATVTSREAGVVGNGNDSLSSSATASMLDEYYTMGDREEDRISPVSSMGSTRSRRERV